MPVSHLIPDQTVLTTEPPKLSEPSPAPTRCPVSHFCVQGKPERRSSSQTTKRRPAKNKVQQPGQT